MNALPSARHLTTRQRYCVGITLLLGLNKREAAKNLIRRARKEARLPRAFFDELFLHLSLLFGFPTMLDGLEFTTSLFGIGKEKDPRKNHLYEKRGLQILRRVYGNQTDRLLGNLRVLHADLPSWIVEDVYGKVFGRKGLSLSERELANAVALAAQGLHRQLYSHIRGSLRMGIHPQALKEIMRLVEKTSGRSKGSLVELVDEIAEAFR